MKRILFQLLIFAVFIHNLNAQTAIKHSLACTDYTQGMVCIISDEGKLVWQYPAEKCNDL